jgi:hypothetical protein
LIPSRRALFKTISTHAPYLKNSGGTGLAVDGQDLNGETVSFHGRGEGVDVVGMMVVVHLGDNLTGCPGVCRWCIF